MTPLYWALATDMLTALATGAAPYTLIHEHKIGRKRWIDTLALQNTHRGRSNRAPTGASKSPLDLCARLANMSTQPCDLDSVLGTMYTLRFPFELTGDRAIADLPQEFDYGPYHARLEAGGNGYVLKVSGFPDKATARFYDGQVRLALYWLLLDYSLAAKPVPPLRDVHYSDDPVAGAQNWKESLGIDVGARLDGIIDGNFPAIFQTTENIRTVTAKTATATVSRKGEDVAAKLAESVEHFSTTTVDVLSAADPDNRLETALNLYGAHIAEHSVRAQFLTLVMAMECLCVPQPRPPEVQKLLKAFSDQIGEKMQSGLPDEETEAVFESLQRELDFRSGDSIRNQMRRLVCTTLASDDDAAERGREMVALYDTRSTLTHTGTLSRKELGDAVPRARAIAQRVLRAKLEDALGTQS